MNAWGRGLAARMSARSLLVYGLTAIVALCLMAADLVGLVPDRLKAVREGRAALAESTALVAAVLVSRRDEAGLATFLAALKTRNPSLRGVRVHSADGSFAITAGEAAPAAADAVVSDVDRIVVPVLADSGRWGRVELQFEPASRLAAWAPWLPQVAPLVLAMGLACTLAFWLYLRRMMRHLDPSSVVPDRVRNAFDNLAEGVLVLDPQGDIVLANRAFGAVAGLEPNALVGRSAARLPWRIRGDGQGAGGRLPWADALADGQPHHGRVLSLPGADGRQRSFVVNCQPIGDGGRLAGVLVSLEDVTELEEKELELRVARDAAQAASVAKSEFLANMSHEIRTPMNAILGFTELLRRGRGQRPEEASRFLDIIHGSGRHLLDLINDILDLSKVEAGHLEVERLPCAVHQVVLEVARVMQVKATEKGIGLRVDLQAPLPAQIATDPGRLRQVITNLVGNAIKFTASGEVRIEVRMRDGRDGGPLCIDVVDSGIGIPADRLEAIFEPFTQAESSTTRRFGGTGLGLTISRRFARALGGDIVASSRPGAGSVFHVTLDAGDLAGARWLDAAALAAAGDAAADAGAGATRWRFPARRVLVVDDGAENREFVRLVLEEVGLVVVQACDGQAAIEAVERERPDLVLMDMQMPVMDGATATRRLRERGSTLPILALTANAMKGFEAEIEAAGFSGHLTKPVDIERLLAALAERLGGERIGASAAAPDLGATSAAPPGASGVADAGAEPGAAVPGGVVAEPIVSRLANHPRLARVARTFCAQLPAKLAEMRESLAQGDFASLALQAHWLKGAGGTVGYDAYFEPARALEGGATQADAQQCAQLLAALETMAARTVAPGPDASSTESARPAQALAV